MVLLLIAVGVVLIWGLKAAGIALLVIAALITIIDIMGYKL